MVCSLDLLIQTPSQLKIIVKEMFKDDDFWLNFGKACLNLAIDKILNVKILLADSIGEFYKKNLENF